MVSQKLLEFAKSFVTDFQLKSSKSSEILLNVCYLNMIKKEPIKLYNLIFRLHSFSVSMGWNCRSWPTHFSAHNFLSVNILSNVTAAYFVFCITHRSWRSLSNSCTFLYSRTMLSDKQSEHSFRLQPISVRKCIFLGIEKILPKFHLAFPNNI